MKRRCVLEREMRRGLTLNEKLRWKICMEGNELAVIEDEK